MDTYRVYLQHKANADIRKSGQRVFLADFDNPNDARVLTKALNGAPLEEVGVPLAEGYVAVISLISGTVELAGVDDLPF